MILERQSSSEVKMGRDSTICKKLHLHTVEHFNCFIVFLLIIKFSGCYSLQYITSGKMCAKDKAENQYWTHIKNCRGNHCVDSSTLPEIIVREHASPWRLPMQFKALSCKEVVCEHDPEALLSSLGQNSFKIDWGKVENSVGVSASLTVWGCITASERTQAAFIWYENYI